MSQTTMQQNGRALALSLALLGAGLTGCGGGGAGDGVAPPTPVTPGPTAPAGFVPQSCRNDRACISCSNIAHDPP